MASTPERESILPPEGDVVVRPETLSEKVEKIAPGVQVTQTQFTKQITDDRGRPLVTTPQTQQVIIELPQPEETLLQDSKGDTGESRTWLAKFWLRLVEKAKFFGWQVVSLVSPKTEKRSNA